MNRIPSKQLDSSDNVSVSRKEFFQDARRDLSDYEKNAAAAHFCGLVDDILRQHEDDVRVHDHSLRKDMLETKLDLIIKRANDPNISIIISSAIDDDGKEHYATEMFTMHGGHTKEYHRYQAARDDGAVLRFDTTLLFRKRSYDGGVEWDKDRENSQPVSVEEIEKLKQLLGTAEVQK